MKKKQIKKLKKKIRKIQSQIPQEEYWTASEIKEFIIMANCGKTSLCMNAALKHKIRRLEKLVGGVQVNPSPAANALQKRDKVHCQGTSAQSQGDASLVYAPLTYDEIRQSMKKMR